MKDYILIAHLRFSGDDPFCTFCPESSSICEGCRAGYIVNFQTYTCETCSLPTIDIETPNPRPAAAAGLANCAVCFHQDSVACAKCAAPFFKQRDGSCGLGSGCPAGYYQTAPATSSAQASCVSCSLRIARRSNASVAQAAPSRPSAARARTRTARRARRGTKTRPTATSATRPTATRRSPDPTAPTATTTVRRRHVAHGSSSDRV